MTIPTAPSALVATTISASSIGLTWSDNSSDETSFSLERSLNGSTGWAVVATPAANATSYTDTDLNDATWYFYRLRAHNASGYSAYTSVAHALTWIFPVVENEYRLFLLEPDVVFAARVNLPDPADYPVLFVAFDTVTTGAYTDIRDGMTLLLGSVAGGDQYGRQRVRGDATAIKVNVGRSSQGTRDGELYVVDNAYLTVLDDRRVWAKMPYIDSAGEIFKDGTLEVGDRTTDPPPVANCGQGFAACINDFLVITVYFDGSNSFAVADGATITGYLWDIKDGTLMTGSALTDASIYVTFQAGKRYVELTVTDSNGKEHTASCLVVADDPDDRLSFGKFKIVNQAITRMGRTLTVGVLEEMLLSSYPAGTLAMIWNREPVDPADRSHMVIIGWLDTEDNEMHAGKTGLLQAVGLTILDVAAKANLLPGFAQTISDDELRDTDVTADITWAYMVLPDANKFQHYLLYWHSTILEVADWFWFDSGPDYSFALWDSDGESIWQQVSKVCERMCPGFMLTCDQGGTIRVIPYPMVQDIDERTATVQAAITEDDWSDITFTYQRAPRVHWLRTNAVIVQSSVSFNTDGSVYMGQMFSIAPGVIAGQGLGEQDAAEQLAHSQDALNGATGHKYAMLNNPLGQITVTLVQDDDDSESGMPWREIEPALLEWVTLTVSSETAAQRGLTFTELRCLPLEVNISYDHRKAGLLRKIELTLEAETDGQAGATILQPDVPPVGQDPDLIPDPIPPPDSGLITGSALVAGIGKFKLYRTEDFETPSGSGGPTWEAIDLTGAEEIMSWVVDPFSDGYIEGSGAIDGFIATADNVYRVSDIFGTPVVNAIMEFATTASWRTIQASFGSYFNRGDNPWLLCLSYYGSTGGHTGTWATYSLDAGVTWSTEVQVSAFYDSGGAVSPIGVYTSPKTPGLAYCAAHTATANPATGGGYVSYDWGATWALMSGADDPAEPLALWAIIDSGGDIVSSHYGATGSYSLTATASGGVSLDDSGNHYIVVAIPTSAVRVEITASWTDEATVSSDAFTSFSATNSPIDPLGETRSTDFAYHSPSGAGGATSQTYTLTWNRGGGYTDWDGSRETLEAATPPIDGTDYCAIQMRVTASKVGGGSSCIHTITHSVTITEIELENGHIYTPTDAVILPINSQAGEIHLPWPDNDAEDLFFYGALDRSGNRLFALKRATSGTVEDISPNDGSRDYGIQAGHFAVRTHDSDRSFVVAAVSGNDADSNSAHDKQGVYVSDDGGDTWTQIVAPATGTEVYQAAFGGDSEQILYVWGPAAYFKYSANFGASLDSRAGNLGALSATKIIGICGGPTG